MARLKSVAEQINVKGEHKRSRDNNLIAFSWVGGSDGLRVVWLLLDRVDWPCTMYFVLIGDNPITLFHQRVQQLGYSYQLLAKKQKYNEILHIVKIQRS